MFENNRYMIIDDWDGLKNHRDFFNYLLYSDEINYKRVPTTTRHEDLEEVSSLHSCAFVHKIQDFMDNKDFIPKVESPLFWYVLEYIVDLKKSLGLTQKVIGRSSLNVTYPENIQFNSSPHVDHPYPHLQTIVYLNDSDGDTILYDHQFQGNDEETTLIGRWDLPELIRVSPKKDRILVFDGSLFHATTPPTKVTRNVLVTTIL